MTKELSAMDVISRSNGFQWSYSKLHAYETCPRRYHETQVKKAWPEEKSDMLTWGDAVHRAMATALRDGTHLPLKFQGYQSWIDKIGNLPGELMVEDECRWAVSRDLRPTAYFASNVWLRCIADAVKIGGDKSLLIDWKTGKSANADPVQLLLTSLTMLIHFPQLQRVRSYFIWLQEDSHSELCIDRSQCADHWAELMPRVARFEQATVSENYPPTPNRFCRSWCPIRSCEYWGK
jgi:PD-(D/E)XK nuclease superfamily